VGPGGSIPWPRTTDLQKHYTLRLTHSLAEDKEED